MKCGEKYPTQQRIIYGEGEPHTGYVVNVAVCGACGTIDITGQYHYAPLAISFQVTSRPALDAVSIPVLEAEKRSKK